MINLVDLTGSDKYGATGASGDRLKEGVRLTWLWFVLAAASWCLQTKRTLKKGLSGIALFLSDKNTSNALGGNSKTIMIFAVSPAFFYFEEALSTLRYADSSKKIKNNSVINESVQDKLIREIKEDNAYQKNYLSK